VSGDNGLTAAWEAVLAHVIDAAHLAIGEQLSVVLDDAVRPLGLTADVLVADTTQRVLTNLRPEPGAQLELEGTTAGRAYQFGEILPGTGADGALVLWVPVIDGTDRLGVMRVGFDGRSAPLDGVGEDPELRRRLWTLAGLMGHIVGPNRTSSFNQSWRRARWRSSSPTPSHPNGCRNFLRRWARCGGCGCGPGHKAGASTATAPRPTASSPLGLPARRGQGWAVHFRQTGR
jgi:hypothetical protein